MRQIVYRYGWMLDEAEHVATESTVDYTHDGRVRQVTRQWRQGDAQLSSPLTTTYRYDDAGRIDRLLHEIDGTLLVGHGFAYNQNRQITVEEVFAGDEYADFLPSVGRELFDYDARGQLLAAGAAFFDYDPSGNRIEAGQTTAANNRLIADERFDYLYDGEGNQTRRTERATGVTRQYAWDHRNRLVSAREASADGATVYFEITYRYDADDRLILGAHEPDAFGAGHLI